MLLKYSLFSFFFFSSRRRHTRCGRDWSSDVCSSDSVVKIYKKEGIKNANSFMLGTFIIIALQTYLAVFFARIIDKSLFITGILREVGLVVFTLLTVYFFVVKPPKKIEEIGRAHV